MPYKIIIHYNAAFRTVFISRYIEEIHIYIDDIRKSCLFLSKPMPKYSIRYIHYADLAPEIYY
mgnify:CR=1 FL=1